MNIFKIFKKKCRWCIGKEIKTVHFENPINGDDISVQVFEKEIIIGFNDSKVGGVDINYCPMCGRRLVKNDLSKL